MIIPEQLKQLPRGRLRGQYMAEVLFHAEGPKLAFRELVLCEADLIVLGAWAGRSNAIAERLDKEIGELRAKVLHLKALLRASPQ